jgi:hypothetical protein
VNVADVQAMMRALADLRGYESTNSLNDAQLAAVGDLDRDGKVSNADIQSLIVLLANGCGSGLLVAVPEPPTFVLLLCGAIAGLRLARRAPFSRTQ